MPSAAHSASVAGIPILKRNIAATATIESASAQGSTLPITGASKASPKRATFVTSWKIVWTANQIARLRMTPTIAAVIAESAPASARLPRSDSM